MALDAKIDSARRHVTVLTDPDLDHPSSGPVTSRFTEIRGDFKSLVAWSSPEASVISRATRDHACDSDRSAMEYDQFSTPPAARDQTGRRPTLKDNPLRTALQRLRNAPEAGYRGYRHVLTLRPRNSGLATAASKLGVLRAVILR